MIMYDPVILMVCDLVLLLVHELFILMLYMDTQVGHHVLEKEQMYLGFLNISNEIQ